ncbi:MAG: glycosyltransferase family 4 protein [Lachnospiraceae bacterium]|nr:glycosyltransferase family 4 protein [Lachnospiraceae bacterium]
MGKGRVYQLLPSLAYGDAVSNDALQMHQVLKKAGYEVETSAMDLVRRVRDTHPYLHKYGEVPEPSGDDILLYHLSIGSPLHEAIRRMKCRKVFVYHNITPASFFAGYSGRAEIQCRNGVREIREMADQPDLVLAVSSFNAEHLRSLGYTCEIHRLPILMDFTEYDAEPDKAVMEKYHRGQGHNIVFVGRVAPNKRQQDLIAAYAQYRRDTDPEARLFLVGGNAGLESYDAELRAYARALGVEDGVRFTGHVRFPEILAYYRIADAFLSLSRHEGFCVPLLEALYFDAPVLALDKGAVAETLSGAGELLASSDPKVVSEALSRVLHQSPEERKVFLEKQHARLADFAYEKTAAQFLEEMEHV